MTTYILDRKHGGAFMTPDGMVSPGPDGLYRLTDAQREHLQRSFAITATPAESAPSSEPSEQERAAQAVAQANIHANVESAQQHAIDAQRIPVPSPKPKRKR